MSSVEPQESPVQEVVSHQKAAIFPVKPEKFWAVFSEKLRSEWNDPQKQVPARYIDKRQRTHDITNLVKNLAPNFDCISDVEFHARIDVCYFDKGLNCPEWSEWALEVAIEIENEAYWYQELCKLLLVNAGLKVLITYEDYPVTTNHQTLVDFARYYRSRKYHSSKSGWLFIFGPRLIAPNQDFVAFTFDGEKINDITDGRRTIC
jgi:hypothetical protein